jgi:hypothetical protein
MGINIAPEVRKGNTLQLCNDVLRERAKALIPEAQHGWLAKYVLGIPESTFSCYLTGQRSFPAWLVPAIDNALGGSDLLDVLNHAENRESVPTTHKEITPEELDQLFTVTLEQFGQASAEIHRDLKDWKLDPDERERIHRHAVKLRQFFQTIEEQTL